ncbi:hypothetical protein P0E51_09210 [Enterococcus faecalis]|uniref:hypothetical protein n=1 Tax=Enterococcus faecalis TaxID=1351 RepID=UPI0025B19118|nr:hypothetical protein [Enterococcus faecalis]MDN3076253.1 hypothetical protein [Enterococcus faecalis]
MKNPYVQITDQEQYKKAIRRIPPKDPNIFLIERPTAGEIIALWWTTSSRGKSTDKYIPKYFKRIYRVDMIKQRKLFIKANVISEENNTYVLTELGEMLVHKYFYIIEEHNNSSNDSFNTERRKLADKILYSLGGEI